MKVNDATHNRPEGNRMIDGPVVIADINDAIFQLQQEEEWEKGDRNAITLFKTNGLTTVLICLHADSGITNNTIDGTVTIQVVEGNIKLTVDNDTTNLVAGQIIMLQSKVWHNLLATQQSTLLLTNHVHHPADNDPGNT